jgi:hypothetical protein
MSYPDDSCASAISVSSPTAVALHSSLCALSYWQRRKLSRDQRPARTAVPHVAVSEMRRSHVVIGTAHSGSVAAPFPSCTSYAAIMNRSFPTRLYRTLLGCRPMCVRAPQRHFPTRISEYSIPCLNHFASPTPPTTCSSSLSNRLSSIQSA